jgi:hypothetical protein
VGDIIGHAGELSADPTMPLLTVVEDHSKIAVAYANQTSAEKIHVADRVKLVPRGLTARPVMGRVVALAPSITEIPTRFRRVPTLQEFGRNIYIELDVPDALPGRALDAVFLHSKAFWQ